MTSKEKLKIEINMCIGDAEPILLFFQGKLKRESVKEYSIQYEYQKWYSKALKVVEFIGKDRFQEFKSYYEIDPKRKSMGYGNYFIHIDSVNI